MIAQAIRNLLDGELFIPHAIEANGQIIQVYDAVVHEALSWPDTSASIDTGHNPDMRWMRCRRPLVTVGGELTLSIAGPRLQRSSPGSIPRRCR